MRVPDEGYLGGMEKEVMKGLGPSWRLCVLGGAWVQILLIQACDVSCLALELSSVRGPRRRGFLELIQKQSGAAALQLQ